MKVFLACTSSTDDYPYACREYERFVYYQDKDEVRNFLVVDDPATADMVVFIGSYRVNYADIVSTELFQGHRDKAVLFYIGDKGVPTLTGVYACLEKSCAVCRPDVLAGFFFRVTDDRRFDNDHDVDHARYLFSFIGNVDNHRVRKRVLGISHPRALVSHSPVGIVDDTTGERFDPYVDAVLNSKFVLCPRGIGVSLLRYYEAMRAGRVPVIISNDWTPTPGPDWQSFAVFVKERDVMRLPAILEEKESMAKRMGELARREWEKYFSEGVVFNTVMELLKEAHLNRHRVPVAGRWLTYAHYAKPYFLRHWVLSPLTRQLLAEKRTG